MSGRLNGFHRPGNRRRHFFAAMNPNGVISSSKARDGKPQLGASTQCSHIADVYARFPVHSEVLCRWPPGEGAPGKTEKNDFVRPTPGGLIGRPFRPLPIGESGNGSWWAQNPAEWKALRRGRPGGALTAVGGGGAVLRGSWPADGGLSGVPSGPISEISVPTAH